MTRVALRSNLDVFASREVDKIHDTWRKAQRKQLLEIDPSTVKENGVRKGP